ncbi:MAG: NHL repeat-containing protein [Gemmatimonadota bacterium]|nr:MAG: NHL repeat-containing protein [Gemmatimonadota bacterium]
MQLRQRLYTVRGYLRGLTAWAVTLSLVILSAADALGQAVPKAGYVPEGSFQLPGKGQPGAPDRPAAVVLGPDRTVHIADERGLIFVFDSTGVYRRSYGQGDLRKPAAIGITAAGESYVLDTDRNQVFVFGPGGQRVRTIASKGDRGGQLANPVDMALGPSGHVYVLDAGRRGVQVFSQDGLFVRAVDLSTTSSQPVSLAVGSDGWMYIADERTPNHIHALPPFTDVPWVGPTPRGLAGQISFRGARFEEPVATAVNEFGSVIVLDKEVGRLYRVNGDQLIGPDDVLYGGIGTGRGSFREAVDIAFAGPDELLILDSRLRKVERIRLTTEEGLTRRRDLDFPIRVTQVGTSLAGMLLDVAAGPDGRPRFLIDSGDRALALVPAVAEVRETVYGDSVPVYLHNPEVQAMLFSGDLGRIGAAALTDSTVVIADARRNCFAIYDLEDGAPLGTYGDNYQDDRRLRSPQGVAVMADGRIVIADTGNNRVKIFSPDLASLVASYPFPKPVGVAVDPDGEIYVWDEDGIQVAHLNSVAQTFDPLEGGLLPGPVAAITFDQAGNFFALHSATHRVTIIRAGFEEVLTQLGAERGLDRPTRINVDRDGNIYITDEGAKRTVVFRWDVQFPPLAGFDVDFETDAALMRWSPGPAGFVRGYEIQGAAAPEGPYSAVFLADASPLRITSADVPERPPRYIRVAPVFITGVRGRASNPLPLAYFAANRAYQNEDYATALLDVAETDRLLDAGVIQASDEVRGRILFIAVGSAYAQGEFQEAVEWARKAASYLDRIPREQIIQFDFMMAEVYMHFQDPRAASQHILHLVGQGPRPEYYENSQVIEQSFRVYRGVRDVGYPEDGLEYLRLYQGSIPQSIQYLKDEYADSVVVLSTRHLLGPGFRYWNEANYGQVVAFFEDLLRQGNLISEQTVVARQVLACAYFAYGDRGRAEDTFREIFSVRPDFNLDREIARLGQLYGLRIYNPETQRFFGNVRPGA